MAGLLRFFTGLPETEILHHTKRSIDRGLFSWYKENNLTGVYLAKHTGTTPAGVKAIRTAGSTADWRVYRLID